jgi:hypothetical protein
MGAGEASPFSVTCVDLPPLREREGSFSAREIESFKTGQVVALYVAGNLLVKSVIESFYPAAREPREAGGLSGECSECAVNTIRERGKRCR